MARKRKATVVINAIDKASPKFKKVSGALRILGGVAAGIGAYQLGRVMVSGLRKGTAAAAEQERINAKLAQSIRLAGQSVKKQLPVYQAMANRLQQWSGVANESIQQGQALLVSMGKLSGDGLERATRAALDLAAAQGISVKSAFDLVAKASVGYTSTLSRYGIILDENTPKEEKFATALAKIEELAGGQAAAQLETYAGQVRLVGENWADVLKGFGTAVSKSGALKEALVVLNEILAQTAGELENTAHGTDLVNDSVLMFVKGLGIAAAAADFLQMAFRGAASAILTSLGWVVEKSLQLHTTLLNIAESMMILDPLGYGANALEKMQRGLAENIRLAQDFQVAGRAIADSAAESHLWFERLNEKIAEVEARLRAASNAGTGLPGAAVSAGLSPGGEPGAVPATPPPTGMTDEQEARLQIEQQATNELIRIRLAGLEQYSEEAMALEMALLDRQYAAKRAKALEVGADLAAIDAAHQEAKNNLVEKGEKYQAAARWQGARAAMSAAQQVFGQSKSMAIAGAIMNTYEGATKAYQQYGWPWGAVAAALTIVAGMKQVAMIRKQNPKKHATGGIVQGPAGIDRVPAMLTAGEGVLTQAQTQAVLDGKAAIVPAGGGGATHITINAVDAVSLEEMLTRNPEPLMRAFENALAMGY